MQHLIDLRRCPLSLLRRHMWPAIPKDLGYIIVVVVRELALMSPTVGVRFILDRLGGFCYGRPVIDVTAPVGDYVECKTQIGGLIQPATTRIPSTPVATYRVLPSFYKLRERFAILMDGYL